MNNPTRDTLFPVPSEFASTELFIIAEKFNDPSVKKYLLNEASKMFRDIHMSEPNEGESAESYLRRRAAVVGGLAVLNNLLSIKAPPKPAA